MHSAVRRSAHPTASRLGSSTSVMRRHPSCCSRVARPCCPGPTRSARRSLAADVTLCATTCATPAHPRPSTPRRQAYTLRDLAADAAALARGLSERPAHLAGIGVGGMVAQLAALDHADAFSALTLAGTRPVAPGPVDDDLPDHDAATMDRLFALPTPDWPDRAAVAEYAAARAAILGDDPAAARATAARVFYRTPSTQPAVEMANQFAPGVLQARPQAALARAPGRARDTGAGGARSARQVLPLRQRRGARAEDPWRAAARARTGRDRDPRHGRRHRHAR